MQAVPVPYQEWHRTKRPILPKTWKSLTSTGVDSAKKT